MGHPIHRHLQPVHGIPVHSTDPIPPQRGIGGILQTVRRIAVDEVDHPGIGQPGIGAAVGLLPQIECEGLRLYVGLFLVVLTA